MSLYVESGGIDPTERIRELRAQLLAMARGPSGYHAPAEDEPAPNEANEPDDEAENLASGEAASHGTEEPAPNEANAGNEAAGETAPHDVTAPRRKGSGKSRRAASALVLALLVGVVALGAHAEAAPKALRLAAQARPGLQSPGRGAGVDRLGGPGDPFGQP
jgi:hypothetical protein